MTALILLAAAISAAPSVRLEAHSAPGPDAFPNARSFVWIPSVRHPLGAFELGARAPAFRVRRDCRIEDCTTTGAGNPSLELAWSVEIGGAPSAGPPRPSGTAVRPEALATAPVSAAPGWTTRLAARIHAPLADSDLDGGRAARVAGLLAPELWPDVTPDALPLVLTAEIRRPIRSWLSVEGDLMLAGLIPVSGGGGVLGALRGDGHFAVAGDEPVRLTAFVRGLLSADTIEGTSAMLSPAAGVRLRIGAEATPSFALEVATRLVAWHADDDLPDTFFPGFSAALVVGFP